MHRFLLPALLLVGGALACQEAPRPDTRTDPAAATGAADASAAARTESPVVYVDVRTPREFAAGHVEGAINIPHTEMPERYVELESFADHKIVVYCRSGRRSAIAGRTLEREGFEHVTNGGGLSDLEARGVPIVR